jgi:hypothetical protein
MFKLDNQLLIDLGLGSLPPEEKNRMLGHIYETLEMRVGMKLAEQMTDAQLDEFEGFIDRNDEPGALKWLETNFPNYKQVVADELEKLKTEIKASAPQILAAAQQAAAAGQMQPVATQPQQPIDQSTGPAPMPQQTYPPNVAPMQPAQPMAPQNPLPADPTQQPPLAA